MRAIPETLQAKLSGGVTTLCWCWRIERADGVTLGFTDHDRDLVFGGLTWRAKSGFQPGETRSEMGLSVDAASIAGALDDETLTEADLARGVYDGARVTCLRVDWSAPEDRVTVWTGELGETRRGEQFFEAELRGLSHRLTQTTGRVYSRRCDAELGDARCGKDVSGAAFTGTGEAIQHVSARAFTASGLDAFAPGWFLRGRLTWTSGENAGAAFDIAAHRGGFIEMETAPAAPVQPGDAFSITAGCDKRLTTCRDKFSNSVNFRGFPFMPGNDALLAGPAGDARRDGGSHGLID